MPCLLMYKTSPDKKEGNHRLFVVVRRKQYSLFSSELVLEIVQVDVGEVDVLLLGQLPVLAVPCINLGDLGHLGAL